MENSIAKSCTRNSGDNRRADFCSNENFATSWVPVYPG